jgi:hypothetical protein
LAGPVARVFSREELGRACMTQLRDIWNLRPIARY